MRNAELEESQAGIKIAGGNINNLRYADGTPLMAESEEPKSLLMKVKEMSEKVSLKLTTEKTKIMGSGPVPSWRIDGESVADFIFLCSIITTDGNYSHEIKRRFHVFPVSIPPSHLPLQLIPLGLPSAPGPSTCFMHPAWTGDLF